MKKKRILLCMAVMLCVFMAGCGNQKDTIKETSESTVEISDKKSTLEDGTYIADFETDSNMFHVNEADNGKGTLTVKDGMMTIHVRLVSKNIVNLYVGTAEDARKQGAELLEPITEEVTYSDGMKEEVYAFDIPVPEIDKEFNVALVGKKETWYDHKVKVTDVEKAEERESDESSSSVDIKDGEYKIDVSLEGGSGRASITSPAVLTVKDGTASAQIEWSSPNYDYMLVGGEKFLPINKDGNSVFEIPVLTFDKPMEVTADTTAMSKPHEVDYTLTFDSKSID
ncbi:MAG: hypothetical protein Q4E73_06110 [Lachnospiraceae bacterium]|nr:hypothetical protein [Lachnospiraceae bacterium]